MRLIPSHAHALVDFALSSRRERLREVHGSSAEAKPRLAQAVLVRDLLLSPPLPYHVVVKLVADEIGLDGLGW